MFDRAKNPAHETQNPRYCSSDQLAQYGGPDEYSLLDPGLGRLACISSGVVYERNDPLHNFNLRRSPLRDLRERHEITLDSAAETLGIRPDGLLWLESHTLVLEPETWEAVGAVIVPDYAPSRFLKNIVGFTLDDDSLSDDPGYWQPSDNGGDA
jgi:hypothetical protein